MTKRDTKNQKLNDVGKPVPIEYVSDNDTCTLDDELDAWDAASDEALENFENALSES